MGNVLGRARPRQDNTSGDDVVIDHIGLVKLPARARSGPVRSQEAFLSRSGAAVDKDFNTIMIKQQYARIPDDFTRLRSQKARKARLPLDADDYLDKVADLTTNLCSGIIHNMKEPIPKDPEHPLPCSKCPKECYKRMKSGRKSAKESTTRFPWKRHHPRNHHHQQPTYSYAMEEHRPKSPAKSGRKTEGEEEEEEAFTVQMNHLRVFEHSSSDSGDSNVYPEEKDVTRWKVTIKQHKTKPMFRVTVLPINDD